MALREIGTHLTTVNSESTYLLQFRRVGRFRDAFEARHESSKRLTSHSKRANRLLNRKGYFFF